MGLFKRKNFDLGSDLSMNEVLKSFPAEYLSKMPGVVIPMDFCMALIDRGICQFTLEAGQYSKHEIKNQISQKMINTAATKALLFRKNYLFSFDEYGNDRVKIEGIQVGHFNDVEASITIMYIRLIEQYIERIIHSKLFINELITRQQLANFLKKELIKPIKGITQRYNYNELLNMHEELEMELVNDLNKNIKDNLSKNGLEVIIKGVEFQSFQYQHDIEQKRERQKREKENLEEVAWIKKDLDSLSIIKSMKQNEQIVDLNREIELIKKQKEKEKEEFEREKMRIEEKKEFYKNLYNEMIEKRLHELINRIGKKESFNKISNYSLKLWLVDRGKGADIPLSRDLAPRPSYSSNRIHLGDSIRFRLRCSHDGYLYLFNHGTSGKLHLLFPNVWSEENKIESDQNVEVPDDVAGFNLEYGGPAGTEIIQAFISKFPIPFLSNIRYPEEGYISWEKDEVVAVLKKVIAEMEAQGDANWGDASLSIKVDY